MFLYNFIHDKVIDKYGGNILYIQHLILKSSQHMTGFGAGFYIKLLNPRLQQEIVSHL